MSAKTRTIEKSGGLQFRRYSYLSPHVRPHCPPPARRALYRPVPPSLFPSHSHMLKPRNCKKECPRHIQHDSPSPTQVPGPAQPLLNQGRTMYLGKAPAMTAAPPPEHSPRRRPSTRPCLWNILAGRRRRNLRVQGLPYIVYMRFARRTEGVNTSRAVFGRTRKDRWAP